MINTANNLVHFGWNKEAIPVTQSKKSLIRRFFDAVLDNICFFRNISCFRDLLILKYKSPACLKFIKKHSENVTFKNRSTYWQEFYNHYMFGKENEGIKFKELI